MGTSPNKFWLALCLILFAGLLLRLPNLNESLWNDEIWSTRVLMGSLAALYHTVLDDWHPPFYQAFMFVWIRLFGDSELSVRMPSLLCGISSIFLVYALASEVVGRKTALLTSFLMAVSPAHIWYSQEARPYSLLSFFLLLALVAYLRLKEPEPHRIWFLIYFGSLFSSAMTHYYLGVYVALISVICFLDQHQRKRAILAMNFLILVCLAAWIVTVFALMGVPTGGGYLRAFTFHALWRLFFTWFLFGDSWGAEWRHWEMPSAQIFFLVVFIYGVTLMLLRKPVGQVTNLSYRFSEKTWGALNLVWFLFALPVFLLVATAFGFRGYVERSMFVALPFFYIVISRGVIGIADAPLSDRFGSFGRTFVKTFGGVCVGVVISLNIFTLKEYFRRDEEWTVYKPNPDWRSTARYLENEISRSSEQPVIFAVIPPLELTYYNSRFRSVGGNSLGREEAQKFWGIYSRPSHIENVHEVLSKSGARKFYLIHNKYWSGRFNDVFKNLLKDPGLQYHNKQSFKGIDVHSFMLRADMDEESALGNMRNGQSSQFDYPSL